MINVVTLQGRLTRVPELMHTKSGIATVSFQIAVERDYKNGDEKETDFITVVGWRKTAEFICRYFDKGQMIGITGQLQSRSFEDKNGQKRTVLEVKIEHAYFMGDKSIAQEPADRPPLPSDDDYPPEGYRNDERGYYRDDPPPQRRDDRYRDDYRDDYREDDRWQSRRR